MPKIEPQSHVDVFNTIARAQAAGKSLEVSKDGTVKEASWGTRLVRSFNTKLHGQEWAKNENARTTVAVGQKLLEAIERKTTREPAKQAGVKITALFERSAQLGEMPSSAMILALIGDKTGITVRDIDPKAVGFKRADIGEVHLDQKKNWLDTGNFLKDAGEYFPPGQIGDASKVRPHVKDLLTDPLLIKDHEVGQDNRFLWDTSMVTPGSAVDGQALANTLDKGKFYNYAVTLNNEGKPVVVLGFEDQADGSSQRFAKGTGVRGAGMGHPTLTHSYGGKAIFGGELMFNEQRGGWTINNSSGRYGAGNAEALAARDIKPDDLLAFTAELLGEINFPLAAVNRRTF